MDEIIEALYHCAIFQGIDRGKIQNILLKTKYQIKHFDKKEFIFREGHLSEYIGIIITGCVEVQKNLASGNVICIFHKNKGEIFGGTVVFSSESVYPCDVFAREKSRILFLHKQNVFEALCKYPLIAANLLNSFANRILYYEKRLELFSYSSIKKKIAFFLLHEMRISDNNIIQLPFTKKSWAEYLNVSRPSLCRELKKLSSNNMIEINGKKIAILNRKKLMSLLQQ